MLRFSGCINWYSKKNDIFKETLDVPLEGNDYNDSKVLINPIVIFRKGHTKYWEACLSCLDNMGLVK